MDGMMNCQQAREHLGPYIDGELDADPTAALESHLTGCISCRAEADALRELASSLSPPAPEAPPSLWSAIESRLGQDERIWERTPGRAMTRSVFGLRRVVALAAVIVFVVGLGLIGLAQFTSSASAATVDFSALLDNVQLNPRQAFRDFLTMYQGRPGTIEQAHRHADGLNFAVPEFLPFGFKREAIYRLRFGDRPGLAATYARDGEFLAAIFHRPVKREDFGTHRDYDCVIGQHRGRAVRVGDWKLVHLTDPSTCHCVLSRLDETTEIPAIMSAISPGLRTGAGAITTD